MLTTWSSKMIQISWRQAARMAPRSHKMANSRWALIWLVSSCTAHCLSLSPPTLSRPSLYRRLLNSNSCTHEGACSREHTLPWPSHFTWEQARAKPAPPGRYSHAAHLCHRASTVMKIHPYVFPKPNRKTEVWKLTPLSITHALFYRWPQIIFKVPRQKSIIYENECICFFCIFEPKQTCLHHSLT